MVRLGTVVLASVATLALATPALAGAVVVTSSSAQGDMGTAHNAHAGTDDPEYIGCSVYATAYSDTPMLMCQAQDSKGEFGFCYSNSPVLIAAAQAFTTVADVSFGWDETFNCSWLTIANYSQPPGRNTTP
jgi:hypothetical protein